MTPIPTFPQGGRSTRQGFFSMGTELYSFPRGGKLKRGVKIDPESMVSIIIIVKYYIAIGIE